MGLADFIHKLLNPHCDYCALAERERLEREELDNQCRSCEYLKLELAKERDRSSELLEFILRPAPNQLAPVDMTNYKPISNYTPWRVERERLERMSARAAKSVEELEKEVGVNDGVSEVSS